MTEDEEPTVEEQLASLRNHVACLWIVMLGLVFIVVVLVVAVNQMQGPSGGFQ